MKNCGNVLIFSQKPLCKEFSKAAEWDTKPGPYPRIQTRQKSGSMNWIKSDANRSGFGNFMRTPDSHRIRTVPYGFPPPDPMGPNQNACVKGTFLRHWWHEIPHPIFHGHWYFRVGPVFLKHHFSQNRYGMDGLQFKPVHTVWGRRRNALWIPEVNKCLPIDLSDSSVKRKVMWDQRLKRQHFDPSCWHFTRDWPQVYPETFWVNSQCRHLTKIFFLYTFGIFFSDHL